LPGELRPSRDWSPKKLLEHDVFEVQQGGIALLGAHAQERAFPAIQGEFCQQRCSELIADLTLFLRFGDTSLKEIVPGAKMLRKTLTGALSRHSQFAVPILPRSSFQLCFLHPASANRIKEQDSQCS
jgi:hypothetical protein